MISGFKLKGKNAYEYSNLTQAKLAFAQTNTNLFAHVELGNPKGDVVQFSAASKAVVTSKKSVDSVSFIDRLALLFGSSKEVTPLLAKEVNLSTLQYPVYASPKIDGWRGMIKDGKILTKSMKPVKNEFIQQALGQEQFNGLDGELVAGSEVDPKVLRNTGSMLSRKNTSGEFTFFVFDKWDEPELTYQDRYEKLEVMSKDWPSFIKLVPQVKIATEADLNAFETKALEDGYEGVMVREPESTYKYGRSGVREAKLLKLKRFTDDEAHVTGFYEDKEHPGRLAGILVKDLKTGVDFAIRTGFTNKERVTIWENQDDYIGRLAKYKHFPYGAKDKPRHATFLEFRSEDDMSADTITFAGRLNKVA